MPRSLAAALALLALAAAPAAAQEEGALSRARLTVTPMAGVRGSLLSSHPTPVIVRGALGATAVSLEPQRGPAAVAGVEVDLRLVGRVGLAGALVYTSPDPLVLTTRSGRDVVSQLRVDGPSVWLARADLWYRLPEIERLANDWLPDAGTRPAGYLLAGPALLRQEYLGNPLDPPELDGRRVDSWAVHVGYRALFPVGAPHLALQVTLEDYLPFWNRQGRRRRAEHILDQHPGSRDVVTADLGYDRWHVPMLTAGLAVRF